MAEVEVREWGPLSQAAGAPASSLGLAQLWAVSRPACMVFTLSWHVFRVLRRTDGESCVRCCVPFLSVFSQVI